MMSRFGLSGWLAGLSALAASFPAQGRIGESPEACIARYGPPQERLLRWDEGQAGRLLFETNGIEVQVTFLEGEARAIAYRRRDGRTFERPEFLTLLQLNAKGSDWNETSQETMRTFDGRLEGHRVESVIFIKVREDAVRLDSLSTEIYRYREGQAEAGRKRDELNELEERLKTLESL